MSDKLNYAVLNGKAFDPDSLLNMLTEHLFTEIIPFWEKTGPDPLGGFNTCLIDDGTLVSRDKFMWGQWRAVWVFARLYNSFGEARWLTLAEQIAGFVLKYGWSEKDQAWRSRLSKEGAELEGCTSIYTDGFAMYALGELFKATANPVYEIWARRTADAAAITLKRPHDTIPHSPYPVPAGARVHGIPMLFSLKFQELGDLFDDDEYIALARSLQDEIFTNFYQPEWDLLVERTTDTGGRYPGADGRAVVPGHVLEDMWFQIHIAQATGRTDLILRALEISRRHLEFGWDEESGGGLLLAKDAEGKTPVGWNMPDMKLWWPHTEALYTCLLAWRISGAEWAKEWYARIFEYCIKYFYMPDAGEWRQKLTRENQPFTGTVVFPVKDPFHLPRSLILQIELLQNACSQKEILSAV
ncbi:MAG: AGE family epimerase/isomerase [Kiritimatiellales bacterium]